MKRNFDRLVPPGTDWRKEGRLILWGLLLSFLFSLGFFADFLSERRALFVWNGLENVLRKDALMPDFVRMLGGALSGFPVLAVSMLGLAAGHYAAHYQGSKSIYLMRRLPSRWELHRRCLTLPAAGLLLALLTASLLLALYYGVYMAFTPAPCLTPDQWAKLMHAWIGA